MEVHQHAHSPDPGSHRGKKKWTHYLWEFLMLFLAVTLGFFVENKREHYLEHKREKKYISSLVNELTHELIELNSDIGKREIKANSMDSMMALLQDKEIHKQGSSLYFHALRSNLTPFFPRTDGTISQLKNAGGLRLISIPFMADSILVYDNLAKSAVDFEQFERGPLKDHAVLLMEFHDGIVFESMYDDKNDRNKYSLPPGNPELLTYDLKRVQYYINFIQYMKRLNFRIMMVLEKAKNNASSLINLLRKEYHLE